MLKTVFATRLKFKPIVELPGSTAGSHVPKSFSDRLILEDIHTSKGTEVAVSDEEILEALRILGTSEGIFAAPEGAAT